MIDIPKGAGQACILLSPSLTATQLGNCTNITGRSYAVFHRADKPDYLGGSNTLDLAYVGISEALVSAAGNVNGNTTGNSTLVGEAYSYVHAEVVVQDGLMKDGIMQDGSFSQHEGIIYTGRYEWIVTSDRLAERCHDICRQLWQRVVSHTLKFSTSA